MPPHITYIIPPNNGGIIQQLVGYIRTLMLGGGGNTQFFSEFKVAGGGHGEYREAFYYGHPTLLCVYHITYPDNPPGGQFPHRTAFGPDEWFYSVIVVLVGSCLGGEQSWGIVVLVGNGLALFLSGGELSSWGVVLEPSYHHAPCDTPASHVSRPKAITDPAQLSLKIETFLLLIHVHIVLYETVYLSTIYLSHPYYRRHQ